MIYLTTGSNGTGKTLFNLRDVRDLQVKTNRPVFYNGRFALKSSIQQEFGWSKFDFKDWESLPDGSILLVDECHNDLPLRAPSVPPPSYVSAIAEHRRRGFDFFLITQHPQNIDAFVRRLIGAPGYHRHLKRVAGAQMCNVLQWDAVNPTCERSGAGSSAERSLRKFPREVYAWYDSAVLHTAKFRIPRAFYLLAIALVSVVLLVYFGFTSVAKHKQDSPVSPPAPPSSPSSSPTVYSASPAQTYDQARTAYLMSRQPYIPSLPYTAPVYAKVTEPVRAPYPAACISDETRCKCYSTQATVLDVPVETCRSIVKTGFFVDFDDRPAGTVRDVRAAPEAAPAPAPSQPLDGVLGASEPLAGARQNDGGNPERVSYVSVGTRGQQ